MSNIKVTFIIFVNTFLISICTIKSNSHSFLLFIMPLIGVTNHKYLESNTKITNKQKNLIELFLLTSIVLFILISRSLTF